MGFFIQFHGRKKCVLYLTEMFIEILVGIPLDFSYKSTVGKKISAIFDRNSYEFLLKFLCRNSMGFFIQINSRKK